MIGLLNIDETLTSEISKNNTVKSLDNDDTICDVVYIDWIPTHTKDKSFTQKLIRQVSVVDNHVKAKKLLLIFDRFRGMTNKEVDFFKKQNAKLFEPALHLRSGFKYLPQWIKIKTLFDIELDDKERDISILYKGDLLSDRIKSFDNYYLETKKLYNKQKICYNGKHIVPSKAEEYETFDLSYTDDGFSKAKYTIIIGSNPEYKDGYIDNTFFEALNQNCVPLLPIEHRYFCGLKGISVDPSSLSWYINVDYRNIYVGLLYCIYDDIKRLYSEFDVKNVAEVLRKNNG